MLNFGNLDMNWIDTALVANITLYVCRSCTNDQCDSRVTARLHNTLKHNNFPLHTSFITVREWNRPWRLMLVQLYYQHGRSSTQHKSYAEDCRPCSQPCNAASPTGKGFLRSLSLGNCFVVLALLCCSVIKISRRSNEVCENSAASVCTVNVYQ